MSTKLEVPTTIAQRLSRDGNETISGNMEDPQGKLGFIVVYDLSPDQDELAISVLGQG